ncbi:MAG: acetyl-CoA carboxylase biotin carboxylase subunit [Chloroflexi bacterium]|nr:acetyl-CoA carboxylase biotin carboxylase subunit [Chloroflexota bacterium]MXZ63117.1 acetyl-CoA carboxylase biotin carboxylase subunit [Chloroflexota bacterium]
MPKRVLLANRGEIALRVQRTCRELGIETVAVYSEPDRNALHVRQADAAVAIGPGPATESYLVIDNIIEAAKRTGADAVHPGYGFLSENAAFAEACDANGITFIGPPASAMQAMGDKVAARRLMADAGVPIIPGANDVDPSDLSAAHAEADRIGFPLMVKAAGGGGGRGIRVVETPDGLDGAMQLSSSEAAAAFGNATVFLERYVSPARHIEVQVMADAHGNARAFGERECSVQRRHQKLLEEAPSVAVDPELRARLCDAATAAALSCGYRNAGTVEFLLDDRTGEFFFLEMNARLQVEHPITELVYGVDLVALQLAVADGEELEPGPAGPPEPNGWSIECRINAEDPHANFAPSFGLVEHVDMPQGPGVRFDSMLYAGLDVPVFYDSLLGKLIVWAEDRPAAIARMRRALQDLVVAGIDTNSAFHLALLDNPDFVAGNVDTGWLERDFTMPPPADDGRDVTALIAAALAAEMGGRADGAAPAAGPSAADLWARVARADAMNTRVQHTGERGWRSGIGS